MSPAMAFLIGCFQAVALMPGISRSGSTIGGGLLLGLSRVDAARFSFLMAVPVIGGAALLTARDVWQAGTGGHAPSALVLGAVVSFVVGVVALRGLIRLISQRKLHWFAYYCLVVATATMIWQLAR
jgi:undecaprenyl-diphosphatase